MTEVTGPPNLELPTFNKGDEVGENSLQSISSQSPLPQSRGHRPQKTVMVNTPPYRGTAKPSAMHVMYMTSSSEAYFILFTNSNREDDEVS